MLNQATDMAHLTLMVTMFTKATQDMLALTNTVNNMEATTSTSVKLMLNQATHTAHLSPMATMFTKATQDMLALTNTVNNMEAITSISVRQRPAMSTTTSQPELPITQKLPLPTLPQPPMDIHPMDAAMDIRAATTIKIFQQKLIP